MDPLLVHFELESLAQHLSPLYRKLINSEDHGVEQSVIDVAVSHAEIMKAELS